MICLNCENDDYEVVMTESFPCSHCDGSVSLEYCLCQVCGSMWRAIDGVIDEDNVVSPAELFNLTSPFGNVVAINPEEIGSLSADFLQRIEEEVMKHENREEASSMSDLVHNCVKCQALAYETRPGFYECSECDFTWEIIGPVDE